MAMHQIVRACGHTETVNISGPYRDRDRGIEYQAALNCRDCVKAEHIEEARLSAQWAADNGLPPLQGSFAQVRYGEAIRAQAYGGGHMPIITPKEASKFVNTRSDETQNTTTAQHSDADTLAISDMKRIKAQTEDLYVRRFEEAARSKRGTEAVIVTFPGEANAMPILLALGRRQGIQCAIRRIKEAGWDLVGEARAAAQMREYGWMPTKE